MKTVNSKVLPRELGVCSDVVSVFVWSIAVGSLGLWEHLGEGSSRTRADCSVLHPQGSFPPLVFAEHPLWEFVKPRALARSPGAWQLGTCVQEGEKGFRLNGRKEQWVQVPKYGGYQFTYRSRTAFVKAPEGLQTP